MRHTLILLQTLFCLTILGLCTFGSGILQAADEITVDASLSHLSFPENRAARLTITVSGTSRNADVELPEIDNIQLHTQGTSTQISVVNGSYSSSTSHNYLIQALKPGAYTIPAIKVTAGGDFYTTKPIHFQVTPVGKQPSGYSATTDQETGTGEVAFIRISKTGSHYPGEIVPFTIKAYFNQAYRADINSLPTLHGDGVVMSQLEDKPQQTEESVKGRKYHVLTWETSLSGIKEGEHRISFSLDATLLIPQKRRSLSPFGRNGFFDDSFFNDSAIDNFFGSNQRKPIISVSPEVVFTVLPLPTDDQPDNFTGAIGDFDLKVSATPTDIEIGEPMTLTMEITGTGNFDRVEVPVFPESTDWKTYSPTSTFLEQGQNYSGSKVFEQAIVGKSGALTEIPSLSFSYFDPRQKRYITTTSSTIAIHLKNAIPATPQTVQPVPPNQPDQPGQTLAQQQQQQTPQATPAPAIIGLAPIHLETGIYHHRIVPLFKNIWLITICTICVLILIALLFLKIQQRNLDRHPEIAQQRHKKLLFESDLKKIEQAQAVGDGLSFLSFARTAIQNQLGLLWNIEPAALSLADIKSRLHQDSNLIEIFNVAEQAAYGGASLTDKKMQDYFITLKTELENLL